MLTEWLAQCEVTGLAHAAIMGVYLLARNAEDPRGGTGGAVVRG
ncbi:MAG TPA: hypothetical protein VHZ03_03700 [Trebonia sp.]|nr:hypothetical protein [Trebonia sp.]